MPLTALDPGRVSSLLILDGHSTAALAVLQSLGRLGRYHCWVAAGAKDTLVSRSRYAHAVATYPNPMADKTAFQRWIVEFQEKNRFDLIIPTTEASLIPLHEIRGAPELIGVLAIPPAAAVETAFDKERLRSLAESLGVPTPRTLLLSGREDLGGVQPLAFPMVVKPVRSKAWEKDGGRHLEVVTVRSEAALVAAVNELLPFGPVQLQEWVPGAGIGVEILARKGRPVLTFAHLRLHEYPLTGGASSYRVAVPPPKELLRSSSMLLEALEWEGVAMVEFRYDQAANRSWLMEINGRFWGSLPLAIAAGADFPRAMVELLLEQKDPVPFLFRRSTYARNVSRDVAWLKATFGELARHPSWAGCGKLLYALLEWGRVFTGQETWDGATLQDIRPFLKDLSSLIRTEVGGILAPSRRVKGKPQGVPK